ncbi:MAG TPA: 50S ribosomal protein L30 [candidate division WOR-3 bacterium]|uniref:50S ribosomal protein L30 n=1 Tax=candidate division WOR-3 bacterium TaxID=2052148 RepID=A0A7C5HN23_UNCW3|nr:50S ribosomal protein L30 [candidate division WOR-3 bacterium]
MAKTKDGTIKVKLVRSLIGVPEKQRRIVRALGLRKLNKIRIHKDTPSIQGMITKVNHLVIVEREKK